MKSTQRFKLLFDLAVLGSLLVQVLFITPNAARAAQVLDIKSFGAKCNGSDDAAAVQSAINSLNPGDILNVSCRAYIGASGLLVNSKSNITIQGISGGGFISTAKVGTNGMRCLSGNAFLYVTSSSYSAIKDLFIDIQHRGNTAIAEFQSDHMTFSGNTVQNVGGGTLSEFASAFMAAGAGSYNTWTGNVLYGGAKWLDAGGSPDGTRGFWIGNGATGDLCGEDHPTVTNNTVSYTGHTAIASNNTNGAVFSNNTVHDACNSVINTNLEIGCAGIKTVPNDAVSNAISYIENNVIYNTKSGQGIQLESANTPGIVIRGNTITNIPGAGIYTGGKPTRNVQILNNVITGAYSGGGVVLVNTQNITISGNKFLDSASARQGNGVAFQANSSSVQTSNVTISNNLFQGSVWGLISMYNDQGVVSRIDSVAITGNSFVSAGSYGIYIEEKGVSGIFTNISASGNCFSQNSPGNISDNRSNPLPVVSSSVSCPDPTGGGGDTVSPTVSIVNPVNGGIVSGSVAISANASDNVGVAGVQFKIDGSNYGTEDTSAPYTVTWNSTSVANGSHTVSAIARDAAGNTTTATVTVTVSNVSLATCPAAAAGSFTGCYYNGMNFNTLVASRNDAAINFDWPASPISGVGQDQFSVRWNGNFSFQSGTYTFTARADDGVRVYVDGQLVVSGWVDQPATTYIGSKALSAGTHLVTVEYYDNSANAVVAVSWALTSVSNSASSGTTIRVNAGGGAYTDPSGNIWSADTGFVGGIVESISNTISGTNAQPLYQTGRWNPNTLDYQFSLPDGSYQATLKFAETYFSFASQRVFNVDINGQRVLTNFDIVQQAGGRYVAIDKTFPVTVTGGTVTIHFTATVDDPLINAIEIVPAVTDTTPPVLTNAVLSNLTASGVTMTWQTDEPSDTQVEYGPTISYGSTTALNSALVTNHTVTLTGLSPSTLYHFTFKSRDASGNLAVATDRTFTTPASAGDATAPSVPANLVATVVSTSQINLSWVPSTDNVGVAGYRIFRGGVQIATSTTASYGNSGLSAGTSYTYAVSAFDAAGNSSAQSASVVAVTQSSPDTTAPVAALSSPATAATLSGTVTVSATGADLVAVGQITSGLKILSVLLDGSVFATSASGTLSVPLDTTKLTNGSHTVSTFAQDNAGNTSAVASVSVTVNNAPATKFPRLIKLGALEGLPAIATDPVITVRVFSPASGVALGVQTLTANANHQYTVVFLPSDPQLVNFSVQVNGYLSRMITNIDTTINSSAVLTVPTLLAGDFYADNVINSVDFSILNRNYNQNYPQADINQDGLVNSLDYAVLKNNMGKSGE